MKDFFANVKRIADSLEVIAKCSHVRMGMNPSDLDVTQQDFEKDQARREKAISELNRLKIPYANEMPTDRLEGKLAEGKLQIQANKEKAKAKKLAAEAEKAKTETTETPPPTNREVSDEAMKTALIDTQQELTAVFKDAGPQKVMDFFKGYKFSKECNKVGDIPQAERMKFITEIKAYAAKEILSAQPKPTATDSMF